MKSAKSLSVLSAVMLTFVMLCFAAMTYAAAPEAKPAAPAAKPAAPAAKPVAQAAKVPLANTDCAKCHDKAPADIAANGGAHKNNVTCQDCHNGHPPAVRKIIPVCSQCHEGKPHYELKGCSTCHSNPHSPKMIKFGNNVTDPCLTCHKSQIEKLRANKSKHTALYCSFCHNVHGRIPDCTQCHKPHSKDMAQADCKACHQAHMPTVVTYKPETPSKFCAACHKKAFDLLTASTAKHKTLACVYCHQGKHKMVPLCTSCHGTPHPAGMMSKFPNCSQCHNIAHDLNHWTPPAKEEAPKGAVKKAPAKR
jgi:predicted CXXCH cytochrome family protein